MKKVYVCYSCDAWHTNSSKELEFISDDLKKFQEQFVKLSLAKKDCELAALDEDEFDEAVEALMTRNQTQGLETNYIKEEIQLNELINC